MRFATIEEFAAARRTDQDDLEKVLFPAVAEAIKIYPAQGWYNELLRDIEKAYTDVYHREGGKGTPTQVDAFVKDARDTLDKTEEPDDNTVDRISVWLATAILNAATMEATGTDEEFLVMEWVTMHDDDVRVEHKAAEGQQRPPGEKFDVGGYEMRYPGDPTAPISLWINCRCALAPAQPNEFTVAQNREDTMTASETPDVGSTPWHGVLAPEGVWSGDGRSFAPNALTHRDLPLPLTYQKLSGAGHDGSCTVAKIEQIARVDGEMRGSGHMMSTAEADEVVGLLAEFGRFGVSVDADDAEFEFDEESGKVEFTRARIASASIVAIPAFAEAWVALGDAPPGFLGDDEDEAETVDDVCDPEGENYNPDECEKKTQGMSSTAAALVSMRMRQFVSDKPWSGFSQADYSDEQWKAACIMHVCDGAEKSCHKLPIKEPGGALNRNGVHAAASRFNQVQGPAEAKSAAKARLRSAYKQLGEEPPDAIKAVGEVDYFIDIAPGETEDGPGWLTHPVDTDRLRDYWTHGEGAAKIGWGTPGDFNRCRTNLAQYIKPQYLNGYCANRHKDALGFWPGEHHAAKDSQQFASEDASPALSLVASAGWCAPSEWFENPELSQLSPITVTEDGRVFGHIAGWNTCHTAYKVCTAPPRSADEYARFLTGYVLTDKGMQPTGPMTYGTGHYKPGSMRAAMSHYDNTGTVAADVNIGEDEHGIWVAGMIRPGAPDEAAHILRASAPSGDWRRARPGVGELELIAILSVNTQGYPIPRVGIEQGEQMSLVAAGVVPPASEGHDLVMDHLVSRVADEMGKRKQRMAALRRKVGE